MANPLRDNAIVGFDYVRKIVRKDKRLTDLINEK